MTSRTPLEFDAELVHPAAGDRVRVRIEVAA